MCHEGTRYCRGGLWSGCESVVTYPRPQQHTNPQAVVKPDASTEKCNDCSINCFVIRDNLDPIDGGLDATSNNVSTPTSGGLTLTYTLPEAGPMDSGPTFDPSTCVLNTAPDHDCDGIPSVYDPYPNMKPFATANPTIFLDVAPGETGTGVVSLQFYLNSADVYFLVDQTGSMQDERDRLKADLTSGDFIDDPTFNCADYDFDFQPNNELKAQGIMGAVRCIIRDANFGVGYFREIPLSYGDSDSVTFRNLQDITNDLSSVSSAVGLLTTQSNNDWPEASMLALKALVTGDGYYFGTNKVGLATRIGCPSLTWGYPCFRTNAIPIVLMFTDAQFHNGPANNNYAYYSGNLGITKGTNASYTSVGSTNETYASAYDLGDLTNSFNSYIGSTAGMAADLASSAISCGSGDATGADAMFKFTLSSSKTLRATTEGSAFDTTLSIFRGVPTAVTSLPSYPNTNDTGATAYSFGNVANKYVRASGNSSTLNSDYSANDVSCSAFPGAKDATFSFSLSQSTKVALDTSGSSFGTTLALFSGTPATVSYTAVPNTNDNFDNAYAVGPIGTKNYGFSGDTSSLTADYTAAQLGCSSPPANSAKDAVYSFSLASPTRVRLSTEDSTIKTVIALTNDGGNFPTSTASNNLNEIDTSAIDLGTIDGQAKQYTGNTSVMTANYGNAIVGCGTADSSKDAVYKFTVGAGSKNVSIDTLNSPYDTVLALYKNVLGATGSTTSSTVNLTGQTYDKGLNAYDLGSVNGKTITTSNGTTVGLAADYSNTQIGCASTTSAPDAVFKFRVDTATTVRMDTGGSTLDTTISLHSGPLPDAPALPTPVTGNEASGSARAVNPSTSAQIQSFSGDTTNMGIDVPVDNGSGCAANSSARDAVFQINVPVNGNYELNTVGSGFDTILGLYPSTIYNPVVPTATALGTSGEAKTSYVSSGTTYSGANAVGAMEGKWVSYTGNTSTMRRDSSFSGCSVDTNSKDAYYSFSLTSTRTVVIDTVGSSFDTVLALYEWDDSYETCNNDSSGTASQISRTLGSGTYYVVVKGRGATTSGAYKITFRDTTISTTTNLLSCDDNGGGGTVSKITTYLNAGTYYAIVKGKASGDRGAYRFMVRATDYINSANRDQCDNDDGSGNASRIDAYLTPGDYYVVVKGDGNTSNAFTLKVQDRSSSDGHVTCNDDSTGTTSLISQSLGTGTYYVVVKGYSTASGTYTLNVRDTAASTTSAHQCDYNSGAGGTSLIERDLAAGNYRVIVKGKTATDNGAYKLILRDLTQVPTTQLACDQASGTGGESRIETTLSAGTYTAILTGDSASSGAYQLSVMDASNITTTDTSVSCNNDSGLGATSSISTTLSAGTYYALVKGYRGADKGIYQLNIGAGSTSSSTFVPPTWSQTLAAVQNKSVKVIPVLSCRDDVAHGDIQGDCVATRTQATALANASGALGKNLQPLVFDIDSNGAGLSKTVVQGIASLANYLEMNVSLRIVFEPNANPGFNVVVRAIDALGDGCSGLVNNEHQRCVPGASPRFEVSFQNPVSAPIAANPSDPNGGYNFRAELIGDQQFIVDKVPIYIVPRDVNAMPMPVAQVTPSGKYWQDVKSPGCIGTQRPDWRDLSWSAEVPQGTKVDFGVCASDVMTDLSTCTVTPLATITGGAACTQDSDCTNGFCSTARNCHTITAGSCAVDNDCSTGATCLSSKCTFRGQPVYVGGVLGDRNGTSSLRMQIGLTANTTANTSPTVHDWALTYICNSSI